MWNITTNQTHSKRLILIPSHFCLSIPYPSLLSLVISFQHILYISFINISIALEEFLILIFLNVNMIYSYCLCEMKDDDHTFCSLDLVNYSQIYSAVIPLDKSHPCLPFTQYLFPGISLTFTNILLQMII